MRRLRVYGLLGHLKEILQVFCNGSTTRSCRVEGPGGLSGLRGVLGDRVRVSGAIVGNVKKFRMPCLVPDSLRASIPSPTPFDSASSKV